MCACVPREGIRAPAMFLPLFRTGMRWYGNAPFWGGLWLGIHNSDGLPKSRTSISLSPKCTHVGYVANLCFFVPEENLVLVCQCSQFEATLEESPYSPCLSYLLHTTYMREMRANV